MGLRQVLTQFGFGPLAKQRKQAMDKERKDFGDWLVAARDAEVDHERAMPNGSASEALTNLRTYGQPEGPKPGKRCVNCRTLLSKGCPPRCGLHKRVVRTVTGVDWGISESVAGVSIVGVDKQGESRVVNSVTNPIRTDPNGYAIDAAPCCDCGNRPKPRPEGSFGSDGAPALSCESSYGEECCALWSVNEEDRDLVRRWNDWHKHVHIP